MTNPLSQDQIKNLLATQSTRGGPKADPTAIREIDVWFKLNHIIRLEGCDNPECVDPRPRTDHGVNIVTPVKGQYMCRYCFLSGWLRDVI